MALPKVSPVHTAMGGGRGGPTSLKHTLAVLSRHLALRERLKGADMLRTPRPTVPGRLATLGPTGDPATRRPQPGFRSAGAGAQCRHDPRAPVRACARSSPRGPGRPREEELSAPGHPTAPLFPCGLGVPVTEIGPQTRGAGEVITKRWPHTTVSLYPALRGSCAASPSGAANEL